MEKRLLILFGFAIISILYFSQMVLKDCNNNHPWVPQVAFMGATFRIVALWRIASALFWYYNNAERGTYGRLRAL